VLSAFLIALREGVEASLVVGIILVYLSRTGRGRLARFVWYGVAAAAALSLGVAVALERWRISEDASRADAPGRFGVRHYDDRMDEPSCAPPKKRDRAKSGGLCRARREHGGLGIFLFVFLMVLREGAELALILRAVELSSEGLQTWIGTIVGIAAAVAVGLFFFKGTLRVPLDRSLPRRA